MKKEWWQRTPSDVLEDGPHYDVKKHLAYVQELYRKYPYRTEDVCLAKVRELTNNAPPILQEAAAGFVADILEPDIFILDEPTLEYPPYLRDMQKRLTLNPEPAFQSLRDFLRELYRFVPTDPGAFTVPLSDLLITDGMISFAWTLYGVKHDKEILFPSLRDQLFKNMVQASGHTWEQYDGKKKLVPPHESKLPPHEKLQRYLADTPFLELFETRVPFSIPLATFKEHGFLFAKSGHGKTQTLRSLVSSLIHEDCALFLIDGNGSLIENIDRIASIKDRLVILDPGDKPALSFFQMRGGSREKQMELFFYLLKALNQELTERQATMISYLVELIQATPGGNLDTLRDVCESGPQSYSGSIQHLSPVAQDFFNNQFGRKDPFIGQTRQQIAQRLYTVARNQAFSDMFNASENNFNAFKAIQEKKIVIVNTNRDQLGDLGSAIFGRFILAQCLNAAFQRPKSQRHLALIICDEAKAYLDDQSQKILSDARNFGLGLLLASQFPDQLTEGVRKEVINNTSIKFAGPAAYSVVAQLHRDMRCEADFILDMKKKDYAWAEWACYVDNLTPRAMKLTVPFGAIEKLAQISTSEHTQLRRANRDLVVAKTAASATIIRTQNTPEPSAPPKPSAEPRGTTPPSPMEFDTDH